MIICFDTEEKFLTYGNRYRKSRHWAALRCKILRIKQRCEICGSSEKLELHHKTYDSLGHEQLIDMAVLCKLCHNALHKTYLIDECLRANTDQFILNTRPYYPQSIQNKKLNKKRGKQTSQGNRKKQTPKPQMRLSQKRKNELIAVGNSVFDKAFNKRQKAGCK